MNIDDAIQVASTHYKDEHKLLVDTWNSIDGKAQGVIAISGIFLAGILAFIRTLTENTSCCELLFITIAIIFLTLSVISSLAALWGRKTLLPMQGEVVDEMVKDLFVAKVNESEEAIINFHNEILEMQKEANKSINNHIFNKSLCLFFAQILLTLAVLSSSVVALIRLWG